MFDVSLILLLLQNGENYNTFFCQDCKNMWEGCHHTEIVFVISTALF